MNKEANWKTTWVEWPMEEDGNGFCSTKQNDMETEEDLGKLGMIYETPKGLSVT
jgi:hypothetical protein